MALNVLVVPPLIRLGVKHRTGKKRRRTISIKVSLDLGGERVLSDSTEPVEPVLAWAAGCLEGGHIDWTYLTVRLATCSGKPRSEGTVRS